MNGKYTEIKSIWSLDSDHSFIRWSLQIFCLRGILLLEKPRQDTHDLHVDIREAERRRIYLREKTHFAMFDARALVLRVVLLDEPSERIKLCDIARVLSPSTHCESKATLAHATNDAIGIQ